MALARRALMALIQMRAILLHGHRGELAQRGVDWLRRELLLVLRFDSQTQERLAEIQAILNDEILVQRNRLENKEV